MARSHLLPTAAELKRLKSAGRKGDTDVVHVNAEEEAMLRAMGGAGTRNPETGLLEFYGESRDHQDTTGGGSHDARGGPGAGGGRTGNGGGSMGRPGGVGNVGQVNSRPTVTSYGAPIHYGDQNTNPISKGITVAQNPERWATTVDRVDKYNSAARKWNDGTGLSFGNFVNEVAPMGFSMQAPEFNKPATYTGGDYHLGVNPVGALVGAGTLAAGIPGPWGSITGKLYNALGGSNLVLGGPDVPKEWTQWGGSSLPGASMQGAPEPGHPAAPGGVFQNTGGGATHLQPPIAGNPAPSPVAPRPPVTGSQLPPVNPPQMNPGAWQPIAGPSAYGWNLPSWAY